MEFLTFRKVGSWTQRNLEQREPSCFNGEVRVNRYRITVELVEESDEVIAERLQALWETSTNHHHWDPLHDAAKEIGYELKGRQGAKVRL